jgi:DNA-binding CsgD family transcriptional regulator
VADHDFFLCSHTPEDVMALGYDFFLLIIHPKDLSQWITMQNAILKYLYTQDCKAHDNDYFSYTCIIKLNLSSIRKSHYIMTYNKIKPVWVNGQLRFGVCTIANTVIKKQEPLTLHYNNHRSGEIYLTDSCKWHKKVLLTLNMRQRMLLTLAKQGMTRQEMADIMCLSIQTIDRERVLLFNKLHVNTIEQAIIYATNCRLIYDPLTAKSDTYHQTVEKQKRIRQLTSGVLAHIQTGLDCGRSNRSLAKEVQCSETAIRKAIKRGKLIKKQA